MKRYGSWKRDVNVELVDPFTQTIARSFSSIFEKDIFGPLEIAIRNCIAQLMTEFIESAAEELKPGAHSQQKECRKEIRTTLDHTMIAVKETMSTQRKEISRSVAPHIKQCLMESYENARREKGKGSVARIKVRTHRSPPPPIVASRSFTNNFQSHFRAYVEQQKGTMFSEAADTILIGLENAAKAVGNTLKETLFDLAEKVCAPSLTALMVADGVLHRLKSILQSYGKTFEAAKKKLPLVRRPRGLCVGSKIRSTFGLKLHVARSAHRRRVRM